MSVLLVLGLVLLVVLFLWANTGLRIDVPVRPLATPRLRRRYHFWIFSAQNGLRYLAGAGFAAVVAWIVFGGGGRAASIRAVPSAWTSGVSSQVRSAVLATLGDYFSGVDTSSSCRYVRAFSRTLRPPPALANCSSAIQPGITVRRITGSLSGGLSAQVVFATRRTSAPGKPDVCATWTGSFLLRSEKDGWKIARPPTFRQQPKAC